MIYVVLAALFIVLVLAPNWWVKHILSKHENTLENMPGTGGELAQHLLNRFDLSQVKLEATNDGDDHYDPQSNCVRLSPKYLQGKSLTAIAVAAHEVGHAIQFNRNEKVSYLRKRYLPRAHSIQKIGIYLLMALPLMSAFIRIPHVLGLTAMIGVVTLFSSVVIYAAILPEEWDASFNKALPILKQGQYIPDHYLPAIRQILQACAFTYVAAALADILRWWRWLAILRALR
jgi:uncharacterized protein